MTNKEIAGAFRELGQLMELHGDNPYKIRSYQNAYMRLRKLDRPLAEMSATERESIPGVGKAIAGKIAELLDSGRMATLEKLRDKTPPGVREMLGISGFGPKKVRTVWRDLGAETVGELHYAVNENRLIELKGFGLKTQADLQKKLDYFLRSRNQFRYAALIGPAKELTDTLAQQVPAAKIATTGPLRRCCNTLERIEVLVSEAVTMADLEQLAAMSDLNTGTAGTITGKINDFPFQVMRCAAGAFGTHLFRTTASEEFLNSFERAFPGLDYDNLPTEAAVFERAGIPVVPPELREGDWALELARRGALPDLIEDQDIQGVVHSHTTYSDGIHTVAQMAAYAKEQGYGYLAVSDHSKVAVYANGLSIERVREQWAEIDVLNKKDPDFRILKSIECDILADGSLDYPDEILAGFDFVIASIHSNLRMDEPKATERLVRAIEHPHTHMLGHPTGRLLLSRPGYPIDHARVIDACAEHRVCIELNANPYRLDLDWSWIPYALERGVPISINPDAHSTGGIDDIRYGVRSARKGGLTAANCLNARKVDDFLAWFRR